jgi:PPM family protein phosphatase
LKFFNVYKNTDLALDDLQPAVRSQVQSGITAHNEGDAEQIVARLHDQLLPICAPPAPPAPPTPTSTPSSTPKSSPRATGSGAKSPPKTSRAPSSTSAAPSTPVSSCGSRPGATRNCCYSGSPC